MNTPFDPIVSEFDNPEHEAEYNAWFKAKVEKAMADTRPRVPHDEAMARVNQELLKRKALRDHG